MRKLTRAGGATATVGLTMLAAGMALGNVELLVLSAFPLLVLALTLSEAPTSDVHGTRTLSNHAPRRGDPLTMDVRLHVPDGHDLVELHAPIPPSVSLESGSNVILRSAAGISALDLPLKPHARGEHIFDAMTAESIDACGLLAPRVMHLGKGDAITVAPRAYRRGRTRARLQGRGKAGFSTLDEARLGARSTNFRELREYSWGDPPNTIHWKATARRLSAMAGRGTAVPLVSEYEQEGRKTLFVLLDGGPHLRVGNALETGLDHGIEAALGISALFLGWGARVGATTYGAQAGPAAYPDSGEGRFRLLEKALQVGDPKPTATLERAIERLHGHFGGARPLLFIVTRITPQNATDIVHAARRIRRILGERRRQLPLYVVDVRALSLSPAPTPAWESARTLVEAADTRAAERVRSAGARVIPWHPTQQDLIALLAGRTLR